MNTDERGLIQSAVIAGLDPAIHRVAAPWMPASGADMTVKESSAFICVHLRLYS
jgi:hypothetical protein